MSIVLLNFNQEKIIEYFPITIIHTEFFLCVFSLHDFF